MARAGRTLTEGDSMNERTYRLLQWTWGLPQNLSGALRLLFCLRRPHFSYRGAYVTLWKKRSSAAVGMYIFLGVRDQRFLRRKKIAAEDLSAIDAKVLNHEYGHTIQSIFLGPLFLPLVALPSTLWVAFGGGFRKKHRFSYYRMYPENWANALGQRYTDGGEVPDW